MEGFDEESWGDLVNLVGHAHLCVLFCADIPTDLPTGWTLKERGEGRQMIVDPYQLKAVEPVVSRLLTPVDIPQMLDLVEITRPGPFRSATVRLGRYYGHFKRERLVAMAGERLHLNGFTEVSAVCTHPDVQGQGLASALTHHVASTISEVGHQPFLHGATSNERARRVYENMDFASVGLSILLFLSRRRIEKQYLSSVCTRGGGVPAESPVDERSGGPCPRSDHGVEIIELLLGHEETSRRG